MSQQMPARLPESADFIKQAEREVVLEGVWPLSELTRLCDNLSDSSGELVARLNFSKKAGFYCLQGTVEASLGLTCQRCMEPLALDVSGSFRLGLVSNDAEIKSLPADMEPYLVVGDDQSILDILEDELLLSIPIAVTHAEACSEILVKQEKRRQEEKLESGPFAALKDIKLD